MLLQMLTFGGGEFKEYFFRAVLGSQQYCEGMEISHIPQPLPMHSLPCYQHVPPEWYILYNYIDEPTLTHHNHPESLVCL